MKIPPRKRLKSAMMDLIKEQNGQIQLLRERIEKLEAKASAPGIRPPWICP